jgi:hypothetical protein
MYKNFWVKFIIKSKSFLKYDFFPFLQNWVKDPYKQERKIISRFKWKDRDGVIVEFLFEIFVGFLDREDPNWNQKWEKFSCEEELRYYEEVIKPRQKEYSEIYNFIKKDYPILKNKWEDCEVSDEDFFKKEEEFLVRIIKVRGSLWT